MTKDYYEILDISKTATEAEIKGAYRKLAHKYHPDKNGGDDKKFREISEAYQVLSDPEKRKQYDQFGHTFDYESAGAGAGAQGFGAQGFDFSGFGGQGRQGMEFDFTNLGDIFDVFFGREAKKEARGKDLEKSVEISFEDAVKGTVLPLEIEKVALCEKCKGARTEPGTSLKNCPECLGKGKKETVKSTILGQFRQVSTCEKCFGTGKIPESPCGKCQGGGVEKREVRLDVDIPAGVGDNMTIRIPGEGDAIEGGAAGDLYLLIKIKPHSKFKRIEDDIVSSIDISFSQAALGDEISVPTIEGQKEIKINSGTQSGSEIRLKGLGFPHLNSWGKGDHIIKIKIITPKHLSREEKEIFTRLKSLEKN